MATIGFIGAGMTGLCANAATTGTHMAGVRAAVARDKT